MTQTFKRKKVVMKLYKYKEYPDENDGDDAYVLASTGSGKTWEVLLLCLKMLAPSTTEKSVATLNDPQSSPELPRAPGFPIRGKSPFLAQEEPKRGRAIKGLLPKHQSS